jgi:hypothetical protein
MASKFLWLLETSHFSPYRIVYTANNSWHLILVLVTVVHMFEGSKTTVQLHTVNYNIKD